MAGSTGRIRLPSGWRDGLRQRNDQTVCCRKNSVNFDDDGDVSSSRKVDDARLCIGEVIIHHVRAPIPARRGAHEPSHVTGEASARKTVTLYRARIGGPVGLTGPIGVGGGLGAPVWAENTILPPSLKMRRSGGARSWRIEQDGCESRRKAASGPTAEVLLSHRSRTTGRSQLRELRRVCGGDIGFRNGNARYYDGDPLAPLPSPLSGRTYDSQNTEVGRFWRRMVVGLRRPGRGDNGGRRRPRIQGCRGACRSMFSTEDNRVFRIRIVGRRSFRQTWPTSGVPHL